MPSLATRAKLNLTLALTGRRADGYHLLHSLIAFAEVGDLLATSPDPELNLAISGPFGDDLSAGDDNLVMRAARLLRPAGKGAALRLDKRLPVAAGIGGGSGDAAAALRLLREAWELPIDDAALFRHAEGLGADVPVCLHGKACWAGGIGETITPLAGFPDLAVVLVNPGVACPTAEIFADHRASATAFSPRPEMPSGFDDADVLLAYLARHGNDLETPARRRHPVIGQVIEALAALPSCRLARMSGSGATCFGLFADRAEASEAAERLRGAHPPWWVASASVI